MLKGAALMLIIHRLFYDIPLLQLSWIHIFFDQILYNGKLFYTQQWYAFTPEFRSLLFIVLIWLMSYLIHYWFVYVKRVFLFILMTFVYLTVLDVFTAYDSSIAVIRTFIFSFLALGLTSFSRLVQKEQIHFAWKKNVLYWLLPLVLTVFATSIVGFAAPKTEPKWPDPVPFLREVTGTNGDGPIQKVGYGEDDTQLGGDFVQDDTPVFEALVKDRQYWRIEAKEIYSGKGWESAGNQANYKEEISGIISMHTFYSNVETDTGNATVRFVSGEELPKVAYPYGVSRVAGNSGKEKEAVDFFTENRSGSIYAKMGKQDVKLHEYDVQFDEPSYPIEEMREVNEQQKDDADSIYQQLPDELPDRVRKLAEKITAPYDNRYDKAKAIEQYFGDNGFVYQTTDVAVPEGDQDYVDQFLFDSQRGYCDNYSTSMAVMLRTIGIPSRWVKGFTGGEIKKKNVFDDGTDMYEVTNSNAHSWVEVYFPEVGWVPFEPTQGFDNPADFQVHVETQSGSNSVETTGEHNGPEPKEEKEAAAPKKKQDDMEIAKSEKKTNTDDEHRAWLPITLYIGGNVGCGVRIALSVQKKDGSCAHGASAKFGI
ncbi:transglutaminase-like domain-containing protein [Virgibacillus halophilus]|uniref:Transglutaminase-like domain-containing protein n=1 Tax=Tigheibacillus halophilus TaxID=361280 RepID=A0ABU5C8M7_9BACI|nr:transglutaminase-like domain-containing protein [Virgibacillus halophilus]